MGTGNKAHYCFQCQYCLIFTAATHLSFHKQSPCVYISPPDQGIVACVRDGGGGFELHKQSANENRTKFDYCNFPKSSLSGNFFHGNGKFFRDPGKSSPVNIPSNNVAYVHDFTYVLHDETTISGYISIQIVHRYGEVSNASLIYTSFLLSHRSSGNIVIVAKCNEKSDV